MDTFQSKAFEDGVQELKDEMTTEFYKRQARLESQENKEAKRRLKEIKERIIRNMSEKDREKVRQLQSEAQ